MFIGFLHLGEPQHGVCRYGRLLAHEIKSHKEHCVTEFAFVLEKSVQENLRALTEAAQNLSEAQIVHFQFTETIWGKDAERFRYLWTFVMHCHAPMVVTIHDSEPLPDWWREVLQIKNLTLKRTDKRLKYLYYRLMFMCRPMLFHYLRFTEAGAGNTLIRHWLMKHTNVSLVCTEDENARLSPLPTSQHLVSLPHFIEKRTRLPVREDARKDLELEGYTVITLLGFVYNGKGYQLLLRAISLLADPTVRVIFAGGAVPGYEHFIGKLRQLAKSLKLDAQVRITGYLEEQKLEQYLMATDIAVCPYEMAYASSSLSTWISVSRPIITSDLPIFHEYKRLEPHSIKTFSPYTPEALAQAIAEMLKEPMDMRSAALAKLQDRLSIHNIAQQHIHWYQKSIGIA